jgi:dethiobiotin synthetase
VTHPSASETPFSTTPIAAVPRRQVYFIAGTDTDVGKTAVSCALLARAALLGRSAYGVKPITAGCSLDASGGLISDDAERLHRYATLSIDPMLRAPVRLPSPLSPHLAAAEIGISLRAERITGQVRAALTTRADLVVVEGAGGWRVPINARETVADIAKQLQKPVILVVRMRLGCLNHALLTIEAIVRDGLPLAGWVATVLDGDQDEDYIEAQRLSLVERVRAPFLGLLPYQAVPDIAQFATLIRLPDEA